MTDRFRNRYRIKSARLEGYDYSIPGGYFVTICTRDRECWFGEIVGDEWIKTEQIRSNVELDEWGVMPNHFHGIIMIIKNLNEPPPSSVETHCNASLQPRNASLQPRNNENYRNQFGPQRNNLSSIIRGFKSATTKRIRAAGYPEFAWQPRFYDHIIRNEKSLMAIRQYIYNNPVKWEIDRENPESVWY